MPYEIKQKNVKSGTGTVYNEKIKIIPSKAGVEFGKYCAIGPNLKIIGHNHDYNFPAVQYLFYKKMFNTVHPFDPKSNVVTKGKIKIGNDVWIGEDVLILSGVSIGDGCCVGARSVVTKDLPPYTICVGQPCKVVKKRYSDDVINFLQDLKWWDWDEEKIKRNKEFFMTNLNRISDVKEIEKAIY